MTPVQFFLIGAACLAALCLGYIFAALRYERVLSSERDVSEALSLWCESLTAELAQHKRAISRLVPPPLPRLFTVSVPRGAVSRNSGFFPLRFKLDDERPGPGE
jgi:hypothetical protein